MPNVVGPDRGRGPAAPSSGAGFTSINSRADRLARGRGHGRRRRPRRGQQACPGHADHPGRSPTGTIEVPDVTGQTEAAATQTLPRPASRPTSPRSRSSPTEPPGPSSAPTPAPAAGRCRHRITLQVSGGRRDGHGPGRHRSDRDQAAHGPAERRLHRHPDAEPTETTDRPTEGRRSPAPTPRRALRRLRTTSASCLIATGLAAPRPAQAVAAERRRAAAAAASTAAGSGARPQRLEPGGEHPVPALGEHRLGVELHALDRQLAVPQRHDDRPTACAR